MVHPPPPKSRPLALVTGLETAHGAEMARRLEADGHEVIGVSTRPRGPGDDGGERADHLTHIVADLATRDGVDALLRHLRGLPGRPAVVSINVQVEASPGADRERNTLDLGVRGALSFAQLCLDHGLAEGGDLLFAVEAEPGDPSAMHLRAFVERTGSTEVPVCDLGPVGPQSTAGR